MQRFHCRTAAPMLDRDRHVVVAGVVDVDHVIGRCNVK